VWFWRATDPMPSALRRLEAVKVSRRGRKTAQARDR
jgi:hypothetical protein